MHPDIFLALIHAKQDISHYRQQHTPAFGAELEVLFNLQLSYAHLLFLAEEVKSNVDR